MELDVFLIHFINIFDQGLLTDSVELLVLHILSWFILFQTFFIYSIRVCWQPRLHNICIWYVAQFVWLEIFKWLGVGICVPVAKFSSWLRGRRSANWASWSRPRRRIFPISFFDPLSYVQLDQLHFQLFLAYYKLSYGIVHWRVIFFTQILEGLALLEFRGRFNFLLSTL